MMNVSRHWPSAWLLALILAVLATGSRAEEDPRLQQSRELVSAFASQLKSELQTAMSEGGPATAIRVCKDVAPALASELSRQHGAKVGRTSLRVRNPANLPTEWQSEILRAFDESAAGDGTGPLEHFEARPDGQFRYMKAIPTGGVCLACHGTEVPADVQALLEDEYPHDRARGYAPGDIRGAFSMVWPADGQD